MTRPVTIGLALVAMHSLAAIAIFINVAMNEGVAQAGFLWFYLFAIDMPAVYIGYEWFGWLLESVNNNMRALVITGILGGLQWFVIGAIGSIVVGKLLSWRSNAT